MIFTKRTVVLLLVCCWIASNVDVVWCHSIGEFPLNVLALFRFLLDLIFRSALEIFTPPRLPKAILSEEYVEGNVAVFRFQGRRDHMEDRHDIRIVKKDGIDFSLFAVFDGHGGEFAAKYASLHLTAELEYVIRAAKDQMKADINSGIKRKGIHYDQLLTDVIQQFDKTLCDEARKLPDSSGTTAIVALIAEDQLFVANLGDSRGVMCDHEDNPIPLSVDQKPKYTEHQLGDEIHYECTSWKSLGDVTAKDSNIYDANPSITTFDLSEHQPKFLMFASDGLWDVFETKDAIEFVLKELKENDPMFGAKSIGLEAYYRGSKDNITVMVINFSDHIWNRVTEIEL